MQQLATAGEQAGGSRRRGKTFAATLIALLPGCLAGWLCSTLCRALGLKNELVVLAKLPELHFHSCGYAYLDRQWGERSREEVRERGQQRLVGGTFSLFLAMALGS